MDKVCVVTGGTGGIGSATVRKMAETHRVLLCDVFQDRVDAKVAEMKAAGFDVEGTVCDIADRAAVDRFAEKAASMGKVTGVVQLGGLTPTYATYDKIALVDTIGPMNINEAFYRVMDGGCIIDICSSVAHFLPQERYPMDIFKLALTDKKAFYAEMCAFLEKIEDVNGMRANMAYTYSRCFVYWYARQCAYSFGRNKGIRVVTVSPGVVKTPMSMADMVKGGDTSNMDRTMSWCALGRPGTPDEAAFLFSTILDERNSYLTGCDIYFDGGCDAAGYKSQRTPYDPTSNPYDPTADPYYVDGGSGASDYQSIRDKIDPIKK
jgi:NAD(P)-dependent dehydrogenase (short-subunit alcohol dehydrogenase family)